MVLGITGGLLLWMAFPPLGWSLLGWLAPLPWLLVVQRPTLSSGRRPYRQLYLASLLTWLALLSWVRLPHWTAGLGWLALAAYLAIYLPAFVAVARHVTYRWRLPIWLAAPLAWCGLEVARAYLFTGFAMLLLGHTQVNQLTWIQLADLAGVYGISFVMIMATAAVASAIPIAGRRPAMTGLFVAAALAAAAWTYGSWRAASLVRPTTADSRPAGTLKVGLVQGSIDTRFDDPNPPAVSYETYLHLSKKALVKHPDLQLLVWPESMYWQYDEPVPVGLSPQSDPVRYFQFVASMGGITATATAATLGLPCLVGCAMFDYRDQQSHRYNSILYIDQQGHRRARYDKMHPVMFGEYVPLGEWFPWLYRLTPMGAGLSAGTVPVCFQVRDVKFCPNICFENTVPHLIRRQVRDLIAEGMAPDVLVTATNDGWFWGSSLLDHHLACGVFRAVEMRRPLLIAANTGFSAWIDETGRIRQRGPRREEGLVVATVSPRQGPESLYVLWGDTPAALCLAVVLAAAADALRQRYRHNRHKGA